MLKNCLAALVMVGFIGSIALAADEFPYGKELIGKQGLWPLPECRGWHTRP